MLPNAGKTCCPTRGCCLPREGGRAAFYHLSFQEFLAAGRLRRIGEKSEAILQRYAATAAWHRTLRFLFCALADKDSPEAAIDGFKSLLAHLQPAQLDQDPNPALLLADCPEVAHGRKWNLELFAEPLRRACHHALEHLNPPERAHVWRTLGRLGLDHRPGVGLRDGLSDIAWAEVPAGAFLYGDEKRKKTLPAFCIARYPVTNAQYQAFIHDAGYETDAWWKGLAERPGPVRGSWTDPNGPRETVSWYEAMAYARWLDARFRARGLLPEGRAVRLPTEEEWEKVARGNDGREFPWGEVASGRANINETWGEAGPHYLGQTSAVGLYPDGASPCGALDMAGNVWEWCLNQYEKPERQDVKGDARRVVRGGSWFDYRDFARSAVRNDLTPGDRDNFLGLRLVCVAPIA